MLRNSAHQLVRVSVCVRVCALRARWVCESAAESCCGLREVDRRMRQVAARAGEENVQIPKRVRLFFGKNNYLFFCPQSEATDLTEGEMYFS